tara:strand:+ start:605 stop:802 length:198 start_codon:yes stop_codon:yes gene_type:complete
MVKNINIKKRSRENMGIFNLNSLKMFLPNTKKKSNAKNNNVSVPLVLKKKKIDILMNYVRNLTVL